MQRPDDTLAMFRDHPLFGNLSSASRLKLGAHMTMRSFARGTTIFRKGDAGIELFTIVSGCVRISAPGVDGREAIFNVIREGGVFGEIAMFDGRPRTADAIAVNDCELMVVHRREFFEVLREDFALNMKVIEVLCGRVRQTSEQVEDTIFLDLPARLAKAILRLTTQAGGAWPRRLSVTQREVSHHIGASRESTNKQLRLWAKIGWIRLERACIVVLTPEPLAAIAASR
jgi:CRP/FNR family transcriptional regulator, cyclic AMP receptor protein